MTATSVQLYVLEPAFTNRALPTRPFYDDVGGIGQLSSQGLSYFQTPYQFTDPRPASARSVPWAPSTHASLLIDQVLYASFINALTAASITVNVALFALLDTVAYGYAGGALPTNLDAAIIANTALAPYYQAGSLVVSAGSATGLVYFDNGTTESFVTPTNVSFVFNIPSGGQTLSFAITAWLDNTTFLENYPNTTITAVIPPTNYSDLLTMSLSLLTGQLSAFVTNFNFAQPLINQAIKTNDLSGFASYVAKLYDGTSTLNVSFGIAYVGQVPSFATMRAAIVAAIVASGVGTAAAWTLRIPELYVTSRLYLIPIWDQKITTGSGTLYSGIASSATQLAKAQRALGSSPASALVSQYNESMTAAYNLLPLIVVPSTSTQPVGSLESLFPTYQAYAPTDPNFLYMTQATQAFATALNAALPVADGSTTNVLYPFITDGGLTYVSFTQQQTEFCILTKAFYTAQLSVVV